MFNNEKFIKKYGDDLEPSSLTCDTCVHLTGFLVCEAFPNGIPQNIWVGRKTMKDKPMHTEPVDGDNGIQYKAKS